MNISQSSASEVKSLLYLALKQEYLSKDQFEKIQIQADETRKTTLGLLRHIKSTIVLKPNLLKEAPAEYKTLTKEKIILPEKFIINAGDTLL